MITKKITASHRVVLASLLATVSLASNAEFPQGEFACQVLTESGQSGLVLIQADEEAAAVKAASTAIAWEMSGGESKTLSVVECIRQPDEKFKDTRFHSFYETTDH